MFCSNPNFLKKKKKKLHKISSLLLRECFECKVHFVLLHWQIWLTSFKSNLNGKNQVKINKRQNTVLFRIHSLKKGLIQHALFFQVKLFFSKDV